MTKLAIAPSAARDAAADVRTGVRCWACDPAAGRAVPETAHSAALAAGVLAAPTSARAAEVQAWEEEITACEHTLCLEQHADAPIAQSGKFLFPVAFCHGLMSLQGWRTARSATSRRTSGCALRAAASAAAARSTAASPAGGGTGSRTSRRPRTPSASSSAQLRLRAPQVSHLHRGKW
jgi:hypothetical protein